MTDVLVSVRQLTKNYQALRPLRIQTFDLRRGTVVSLMGLDAQAAEMLVGLLTGAVLPDEGDIRLFGRSTRDVNDTEAWLAMLDQVGIVTDRAVLIAQFTVEQNIAIPFTLQVEPIPDAVRPQIAAVASQVGLAPSELQQHVGASPPEVVARVRLARALALNPLLLIVEHPSASLPAEAVTAYARDVGRIARERQLGVLAITADPAFAGALGGETLTHEPASGGLRTASVWRRIFR